MPTKTTPWTSDWKKRLENRIQALGYTTVSHFAEAHPLETFETLVGLLGERFAPVQIRAELLREAEDAGRLRSCAAALLLRAVHSIPGGWPIVKPSEDKNTRLILAQWAASLPDSCKSAAIGVFDALMAGHLAPPSWTPMSTSDGVIAELFASHWAQDIS